MKNRISISISVSLICLLILCLNSCKSTQIGLGTTDNLYGLLDEIQSKNKSYVSDTILSRLRRENISSAVAKEIFDADTIYIIDAYDVGNYDFNEIVVGDTTKVNYTYQLYLKKISHNDEIINLNMVDAILHWNLPQMSHDKELIKESQIAVTAYRIFRNAKGRYNFEKYRF